MTADERGSQSRLLDNALPSLFGAEARLTRARPGRTGDGGTGSPDAGSWGKSPFASAPNQKKNNNDGAEQVMRST
jgi:hypothetical protein